MNSKTNKPRIVASENMILRSDRVFADLGIDLNKFTHWKETEEGPIKKAYIEGYGELVAKYRSAGKLNHEYEVGLRLNELNSPHFVRTIALCSSCSLSLETTSWTQGQLAVRDSMFSRPVLPHTELGTKLAEVTENNTDILIIQKAYGDTFGNFFKNILNSTEYSNEELKKYMLAILHLTLIISDSSYKVGFNHNDLHNGNILIYEDEKEEYEYSTINGNIKIISPFKITIIDYGFSHIDNIPNGWMELRPGVLVAGIVPSYRCDIDDLILIAIRYLVMGVKLRIASDDVISLNNLAIKYGYNPFLRKDIYGYEISMSNQMSFFLYGRGNNPKWRRIFEYPYLISRPEALFYYSCAFRSDKVRSERNSRSSPTTSSKFRSAISHQSRSSILGSSIEESEYLPSSNSIYINSSHWGSNRLSASGGDNRLNSERTNSDIDLKMRSDNIQQLDILEEFIQDLKNKIPDKLNLPQDIIDIMMDEDEEFIKERKDIQKRFGHIMYKEKARIMDEHQINTSDVLYKIIKVLMSNI